METLTEPVITVTVAALAKVL
ncbi:MAG: hypothetical protein QOE63_1296, partial [Acidimicrobiaceae bacterium]